MRLQRPSIRWARYELDEGGFCRCVTCRFPEWLFRRLGYEWVPSDECSTASPRRDNIVPLPQRESRRCGMVAAVEIAAVLVGVWLGWRWTR